MTVDFILELLPLSAVVAVEGWVGDECGLPWRPALSSPAWEPASTTT